jgi:prepilin-type N-terminal cleavage/methylation domain-containing protein
MRSNTAAPLARARVRGHSQKRGFTLIELMVVMIVIGILAAIAVGSYGDTTNDAIERAMLADLNGFRLKAERHKFRFRTYPTNVQASGTETAPTMNFSGSDGVVLAISGATTTRYTVTATHPQLPGRTCAISVAPNVSSRPECTGTVS